MAKSQENIQQVNEIVDMLRELSAHPLLVDEFVKDVIFKDFHLNLKIYLKKCD